MDALKRLCAAQWKNALMTAGLLLSATVLCQLLRSAYGGPQNASMLFLLAVLLISRYSNGYFWGVFASFVAVPLVNYMFTYPYFAFNLSISGYFLTFFTMLAVSLIVSVLTTQLKRQERLRLEAESEKLRANLLRAVSHDLRTPLTSIVGATGAILDNDLPMEKQRELIADANNDAQWLLRMVENLLAITRITGGDVPLNTQTEVLEDVLAEAVIKFQKHFQDVPVEMNLSEEILLADMDAVLIEQVVQNLLENAVYHGQHTTRITLSAVCDGPFVSVTVADNGAGIAKERFSALFKPFLHNGDIGGADAHRHMGIGLSVCQTIISAHGGALMAQNNELGGASFTFTLPEKEMSGYHGNENSDH